MTKRLKRPLAINQIVKAKLSYQPSIIGGDYYRVLNVNRALSYSRWMVSVVALKDFSITETLDAGYFSELDGTQNENGLSELNYASKAFLPEVRRHSRVSKPSPLIRLSA